MGQYFIDRTHYTKTDHFSCAVEGEIHMRLVPHVYRHEVYAGQSFLEDDWRNPGMSRSMDLMPRESPVNLFNNDFETFPKSRHITKEHKYSVTLKRGDCIFIPAFYFYQFAGEAAVQEKKGPYKPHAIMVNIHYKGNSDMLRAFYNAVETKVLE